MRDRRPRSFAPLLALVAACTLAACSSPTAYVPVPAEEEVVDAPPATPRDDAGLADEPEAAPPGGLGALSWAPPELSDPITIHVEADSGRSTYELSAGRDHIIVMPDEPVRRGLAFVGGRNVVMVGGEIFIPHQGSTPSINARRALFLRGQTGIVHVEGVLMHGDDISEGIQIAAPQAIVQIQNVGIFNVHARDQVRFSDNHPDIIQTWGNVGELRIDGLSGSSDYQGLFFKVDHNGPNHGPVTLRRVSLTALPTARFLIWMTPEHQRGEVTFEDVWVQPAPGRHLGTTVWPDVDRRGAHRLEVAGGTATWPASPRISGSVHEGVPPGGDFVRPEHIGVAYVSPGYAAP